MTKDKLARKKESLQHLLRMMDRFLEHISNAQNRLRRFQSEMQSLQAQVVNLKQRVEEVIGTRIDSKPKENEGKVERRDSTLPIGLRAPRGAPSLARRD